MASTRIVTPSETIATPAAQDFIIDRSKYDSPDNAKIKYSAQEGLTEETVREISKQKNEPAWLLQKRLEAFKLFQRTALPTWGPDLRKLDLNKIIYFVRPDTQESKTWDDVPEEIKKTFDRLGIPEAEKKSLAGVGVQYDSDVVYHNLKQDLKKKGVIFENMDVAVQEYPELVKKYFMTDCIPIHDHKFIMLHAAVWSGGTFIYVPPGVKVPMPLQAYFRMNAKKGGQFEHTLIIVDEGAELHYIEGCSSPQYTQSSLHAGGVEIFVKKGARCRYSSIENWSKNVYNLNTKRAIVEEDGVIEWINGNMGCLVGESKIYTPTHGPVDLQSIQKGEEVYVWDKELNGIAISRVTNLIFSGNKKVYKIKVAGREICASSNHPFLTLERKKHAPHHKKSFFSTVWRPLEQLKPGDVIGIPKRLPLRGTPYVLPRVQVEESVCSNNQYGKFVMSTLHLYNEQLTYPEKTNEDFMWLMGILLGDGFVDVKRNKINIATHITEDYREFLCQTIQKLFNYEVTYKQDRYIIINSKLLCQLFEKIGFTGRAASKQVPSWVFSLPESQILAFLAGYFDSDGHVTNNGIALTSISKDILEQVKVLAIMLGFNISSIFNHRTPGRTRVMGNLCNTRQSYRLLIHSHTLARRLPVRCNAKKERLRKVKTGVAAYASSEGLNFKSKTNEEVGFARIQEITYRGIKPTFDIEVAEQHNFISEGIIVHNSCKTMLYPCSILIGEHAKSDSLGIAFAGPGQEQDTGMKVIHAAKNTTSTITSKSISKGGGVCTYRGLLRATRGATNTTSSVICDALLIDDTSISNTYPSMRIDNNKVNIAHEATVGKIGEEEIFYLMSRGLSEEQAIQMVVSGFIEPIVKVLPLEYAVELNKLIELEMEGTVG